VALAAAFAIAVLATPAGISGAVLLLPFQVSVLSTPSPSVTPTNLLYNVVATPGALFRYWRQGQTGGRLALALIAGTLPGVVAGSVIRVELLPGDRLFDFVVAAVLLPLGLWLAAGARAARGAAVAVHDEQLRPPGRTGGGHDPSPSQQSVPQTGHRATALPVAASTASAAARTSARAGCASRNTDARPDGSDVTRPQSRRHARCFDTVDWARSSPDTRSVTRAGPAASRRTIMSRAGSPSDRNSAAAGASSTRSISVSGAIIAIRR
jgi:hypothetical protein